MCYMLDRGGEKISYVQFPLRFDGVDPGDKYANHKRVLFDVGMRRLDELQGPMYMGTCCIFRRTDLNGSRPPSATKHGGDNVDPDDDDDRSLPLSYRHEGYTLLPTSIPMAEYPTSSVALRPKALNDDVSALLCCHEDRFQWGKHKGWIYMAQKIC